ncbi:addiction module killer protein [Agrobacterium albertimagni AOL15]|uniref:Addiction module killer protein n=1 Tax=Agrobacterium albertimagni AOL15 TaxID=1156935 RepID=K2PZK9_9HYPH|nr:addiction module killer protein [Agrobacterium albertimagni AOL15]
MTRFEIEVYLTEDGEAPFQAWLDAIASSEIRTQILARIRRASLGNFGDWKPLVARTAFLKCGSMPEPVAACSTRSSEIRWCCCWQARRRKIRGGRSKGPRSIWRTIARG